ncbi:MAG: CaiB/BaiF CoA-transferase family protein, partial [Pseudomonadota bacterium]
AVQALAGFLSVNDGPDGTPVVPGAPSADMAAGLTALSAVLMAIVGRDRTGEGAYIDCAMFDSLLPWCAHTAGSAIAGGESPVSSHQRSLGGAAFYQVYRTSDGKHVSLGGREIKFARNLLTALGREDFIDLATSGAGLHQDPLRAFLSETFASRTRDEWVEWFEGRDIAFAPVLDLYEAFHAPHVKARDMLVTDEDGNLHIGIPIKFRDEPGRIEPSVPELAADNEEALRQAGCEEGVIEAVLGKPSVQRTA